MKNFVNGGATIAMLATAITASGQGLVAGAMFGVAANSAAVGEDLVINLTGTYILTAKAADTATVGALAYWDNTAKAITTTATDNTKVGVFAEAKLAAATSATIRLNGSF